MRSSSMRPNSKNDFGKNKPVFYSARLGLRARNRRPVQFECDVDALSLKRLHMPCVPKRLPSYRVDAAGFTKALRSFLQKHG